MANAIAATAAVHRFRIQKTFIDAPLVNPS
jgi:hypothetical protein